MGSRPARGRPRDPHARGSGAVDRLPHRHAAGEEERGLVQGRYVEKLIIREILDESPKATALLQELRDKLLAAD